MMCNITLVDLAFYSGFNLYFSSQVNEVLLVSAAQKFQTKFGSVWAVGKVLSQFSMQLKFSSQTAESVY